MRGNLPLQALLDRLGALIERVDGTRQALLSSTALTLPLGLYPVLPRSLSLPYPSVGCCIAAPLLVRSASLALQPLLRRARCRAGASSPDGRPDHLRRRSNATVANAKSFSRIRPLWGCVEQ